MDQIRERLLRVAKTKCLPYLITRDDIAPYRDRIAFVLVGSVARGLCRADSDVDIALICDNEVHGVISDGTQWAADRPTEVSTEDTQLHYYAVTFDVIMARLRDLDDVYLYVYSHALVLKDVEGRFEDSLSSLLASDPAIRKERVQGKIDMLRRRLRGLASCVEAGDPMAVAKVSLEAITLSLKVIALLDDVPFDRRKRLFTTALQGPLGTQLAGAMKQLLSELGALGEMDRGFALPQRIETITDELCESARKQGFSIGLDKPDRRHFER